MERRENEWENGGRVDLILSRSNVAQGPVKRIGPTNQKLPASPYRKPQQVYKMNSLLSSSRKRVSEVG